jgi:hypothetical protein
MVLVWQAYLGPAPPSSYVEVLQEAAAAGSLSSTALHCLASGVAGPVWEEVSGSRGLLMSHLVPPPGALMDAWRMQPPTSEHICCACHKKATRMYADGTPLLARPLLDAARSSAWLMLWPAGSTFM